MPKRLNFSAEQLEDRCLLSIYGLNDWQFQGPAPIMSGTPTGGTNFASGAIEAVAVHPTNVDLMYLATINGGIWKTTNARYSRVDSVDNDGDGQTDEVDEMPTWTPLTDSWPGLSIGAVAFDPLDLSGNTVYAGAGGYSSYGVTGELFGVLRTTDGGQTWTALGQTTLNGQHIEKIVPTRVAQPGGARVLLAATNNAGLFRSPDSGATWNTISGTGGLPAARTTDLLGDANDDNRFFVAVPGAGIYRSTNGGVSWQDVNTGLGGFAAAQWIHLAIHPGTSTLYAAVIGPVAGASKVTGVFRSLDLGNHWTQVGTTTPDLHAWSGYHSALAADPNDSQVVVVAGEYDPYRFNPQTQTWEALIGLSGSNSNNTYSHSDRRALAFDVLGRLIEADDGGIYRLQDPGTSARRWESLAGNLADTEFVSVAYDPVANVIFGGTQDNGSIVQNSPGSLLYRERDSGDGGVVTIGVEGNTSVHYYSSNNFKYYSRRRFDAANNPLGATNHLLLAADSLPGVAFSGLNGKDVLMGSSPSYNPWLVNRVTPERLLIAADGLYESFNRGDTIREVTVPSFAVSQYVANTPVQTLADADALIAAPTYAAINFSDTPGGAQGHFAADAAFPQGNDDDFVVRATANLVVGINSTWTFGLNGDDGARLRIDGQVVVGDDGVHGARDALGTIALDNGQHRLDLEYFDHLFGATIELFVAAGTHASFDGSFALLSTTPGPGLAIAAPGFSVEQRASWGTVVSLADADALLAPAYVNSINLSGTPGGAQGHFGSDGAFPKGSGNDFATRIVGAFEVAQIEQGTWTFGVNSDDGARLRVDGVTVVNYDGVHAASDAFGATFLTAGRHTLELVQFNRAGAATVELFVGKGTHTSFGSYPFQLLAYGPGSSTLQATKAMGRIYTLAYGGYAGGVPNAEIAYVGSYDFDSNPRQSQIWLRTTAGGAAAFTRLESYPGYIPQDIALDPADWRTAYVLAQDNRIWRTADAGVSWSELAEDYDGTRGLPGNLQTIICVRVGSTPVLLVGGGGGVYRRINPAVGQNSRSWIELGHGMPNAVVYDLFYDPTDKVLLAGTAGRGAWTLGNAEQALIEAQVLTIDGDAEFATVEDTIRLAPNPNNARWLDVYVNNDTSVPTYSVEFSALEGVVVNGKARKDWIVAANLPAELKLTINGGDGDDVIQTTCNDAAGHTLAPLGTSQFNGGNGADWIVVRPSVVRPLAVDGGDPAAPATPADTLNVLAGGAGYAIGGGMVSVVGRQPVSYDRVEQVLIDGPYFPPDVLEPNDSFAQPKNLFTGDMTLFNLSIHGAGNDDWYLWTAHDTGTLAVDVRFKHLLGDIDLELYDAGHGLLASSASVTDQERVVVTAYNNQSYYIRVFGYNNAINPNYVLEITWPFGIPADAYEPNDPFAAAYFLGSGDLTVDDLSIHRLPGQEFESNDDWFAWKATGVGTFNVDAHFQQVLGNLDLELYDSNQTLRSSSYSNGDGEHVWANVFPGQVWYVRVFGHNGATNPHYQLVFDGPEIPLDALEANDQPQAATDLGSGALSLSQLSISSAGEEDWFRWTAPATDTLNVYLTFLHSLGDLDLEFYDANQHLITYSNGTTNQEHVYPTVVAGQSYYIRVFGYQAAINYVYTLDLVWPTPIPPDLFEPNEDFAHASALGGGDQRHGALTVHRDAGQLQSSEDWYRWDAWANGTLEVSTRFHAGLGDLTLELFDARGVRLAESAVTTDGRIGHWPVRLGQSYFIHVAGGGGATNPAYELIVDGPNVYRDAFEPNNQLAEGYRLGRADQQYEGLTIDEPGNEDWYFWTAADTGSLLAQIYFRNVYGNLDLELYDLAGARLAYSNSDNDVESLAVPVVADQTYALRVWGRAGATNRDYDLIIDGPNVAPDALEPNDDAAQAFNLGAGNSDHQNLTIHAPDNDDWYRWTAPADGRLFVGAYFHHAQGDVDLELYDAVGQLIDDSRSLDDDEAVAWDVLASQSYLVRVFGAVAFEPVELLLGPSVEVYNQALQRNYRLTTTFEPAGTIVVTNTLDQGTGSLRQAILDANGTVGIPDAIAFAIPGAGPHVIALASALPSLGDPVTFQVPAGTVVQVGGGSAYGFPDFASLTQSGPGKIVMGGGDRRVRGQGLVVEGGDVAFAAGGTSLLVVDSLAVLPGARLDLADGDLIVRASPATRHGVLAATTALVASGSAGLAWNGPGIASSAAATDSEWLTALGVMLNDNGLGGPYYAVFAGQVVDQNCVLVKYTYYGDADLSGSVDGTDYALTDNGFNTGLNDWFDGDLNYSAAVDGTDYALIDNAFNSQSGPLSGGEPVAPGPIPRAATLAIGGWHDDGSAPSVAIAFGSVRDGLCDGTSLDDDLLDALIGGWMRSRRRR